MVTFSRFLSCATAAALILPVAPVSAAPIPGAPKWAEGQTAHQWGGGWYRRRHRNDVDVGDILTGVLVLGTIATVLDLVTKSTRRNRDDRRERYPDRYPSDERRNSDANDYPNSNRDGDDRYGASDEDQAVQDCAVAAEQQASGRGTVAQVRNIGDVQSTGNGFAIRGTLDTRNNYRSGVSASREFTCNWGNGRVINIDLL